jgi:ATP-dependent RNA helicase DHX37/DHR1
LVLAATQKSDILPYVISIVAGLSVGEPFIRDQELIGVSENGDDDDDDDTNKEGRQKKRSEWHRVMQVSNNIVIDKLRS